MDIRFLHYLGYFLTKHAQIVHVNSGYYHLSTGYEKSGVGHLFSSLEFLGPYLALERAWPYTQPYGPRPQYMLSQNLDSKNFPP